MRNKKLDAEFEDKPNCNNPDCTCNPCSCGEDCKCHEGQEECECNDGKQCNCHCEAECHCNSEEHCGCQDQMTEDETECKCEKENRPCECNKDYLVDLQRLQAEFDNYRKRMQTALGEARKDGFVDAIENFLPALDSFKMATDMITDKNTLMGIKFIEKGILDTLSKMGVEEIDTTGEFNPDFHQAIDTDSEAEGEPNSIVKVASKGFTYNGKVIRYAQVIVKK